MAKAKTLAQTVLAPATVEELRRQLRNLHDLVPVIEGCEQCGECMDDHRRMMDDVRKGIEELLKRFAPKR